MSPVLYVVIPYGFSVVKSNVSRPICGALASSIIIRYLAVASEYVSVADAVAVIVTVPTALTSSGRIWPVVALTATISGLDEA